VVYALMAILAVGLLLRLDAFLGTEVIEPLRADAAQYYAAAHHLRHTGVYSTSVQALAGLAEPTPDAARSPGYPLFLALFAGGDATQASLDRIIMARVLLGTLAILLVFLLGKRLLDAQWALIVALLTALSPHLVNIGLYLLSETLLVVMLLAHLLAASSLGARGSGWVALAAGLLLGCAALVHPTFEYLILPWLVLLFLSFRGAARWRVPIAAALGFVLVFGPWVMRNQQLLDAPANADPIVATIHHGIYPDFMYKGDPDTYAFPYRHDPRGEAIGADLKSVLAEVKRRFVEEPVRHLKWYLLDRPVAMWSWDMVQGMGDAFVYPVAATPYTDHPGFRASHRIMVLLHWPLVLLGAFGAMLAWAPAMKRRFSQAQLVGLRTLSLLLLYATAVHMVGAPFPRYSIPLRPLLFVMSLVPLFVLTVPRRSPGLSRSSLSPRAA
jgi:hypothetical protein